MNNDLRDSQHSLSELAHRLETNGMIVVPYKDYLEIRLPLLASVQVRIVDARLHCEARFGLVHRDRATWFSLIGVAAGVTTAFLHLGVTPLAMALGFIGTSAGASAAIRYQVTEACITRVQTAWMLMNSAQPSAIAPREVRRELAEAAPEAWQARRDHAPVRRDEI
jgi:hypothetical protein